MQIGLKINGVPVLGTVIVENTTYYVDANKKIYTLVDDEYIQVDDSDTLKKILDYITPTSIDVKENKSYER